MGIPFLCTLSLSLSFSNLFPTLKNPTFSLSLSLSRHCQNLQAQNPNPKIEDLILTLHSIEAVKFGTFTLKSGISSPVYIDLRLIVSYPQSPNLDLLPPLLLNLLLLFPRSCLRRSLNYSSVATVLSISHAIPILTHRKEIKSYRVGKSIKGSFTKRTSLFDCGGSGDEQSISA